MKPIEKCAEEFRRGKGEEGAAKLIICLINSKENVYWDDSENRLRLSSEEHDDTWAPLMKKATKALGAKSRDEYIKIKNKYNLTQF